MQPGDAIGRYIVVSRLGSGGMGEVYRAKDPELDRHVAIKILHELIEAQGLRIIDEARALAKVNHPNVVPIYEVGTHDHLPFLVMQLIEGVPMSEWLLTPHTWREKVTCFIEAARALAATHDAGLVHGDFKPSNMLVGADGHVRLIDFGLGIPRTPSLSLPEQSAAGTPAYMAPEVRGGERPDVRSDQYSFFVSLFQVLFGKLPFADHDANHIASALISGMSPSPPRHARVPRWLIAAVTKGLGPRETRFASMLEVLRSLEKGISSSVRSWRSAAIATVALASIIAAIAWRNAPPSRCLDAGATAQLWTDERASTLASAFKRTGLHFASSSFQLLRVQVERCVASAEATNLQLCALEAAHTEADERTTLRRECMANARTSLETFLESLAQVDRENVTSLTYGAYALPAPEKCVTEELHFDAASSRQLQDEAQRALQLVARAQMLHATQQFAAAEASAQKALEVSFKSEHPPVIAEAQFQLGSILVAQGRAEAGLPLLKEGAWTAERHNHFTLVCKASIAIMRALAQGGNFDEAQTYSRMAASTLERLHSPAILRGQYESAVAWLQFVSHRYLGAISHNQNAIRAFAESIGPSAPETLQTRLQLADALRRSGQYRASVEEAKEVVGLAESAWGAQHPLTAAAWRGVASGEYRLGHYADAAKHYEMVIDIYRHVYGADSHRVKNELTNLASVNIDLARVDEATLAIEEAARIEHLRPAGEREALQLRSIRSFVFNAQGHYALAHAELEDILARQRVLKLPEVEGTLSDLGEIELQARDGAKALAHYRECLPLREAELGANHPDLSWVLNGIGAALQMTNHWQGSLPFLRRAHELGSQSESHPDRLATTKWLLAQALSRQQTPSQEALQLAIEAEAAFEQFPAKKKELKELRRWLRVHR